MIKNIGGFFRMVFFLAALLVVGYNTWEMNRLRAEVAQLRQQITVQKKHVAPGSAAGVAEPPPLPFVPQWMNDAQKHAERAQAFLRTKRVAEAKSEMDQALALVQKNGQAAQKESRDALQKLQKAADAVSAVSDQAKTLWGDNTKAASDAGAKKP